MLRTRRRQSELMDAPDLAVLPHHRALRGLQRVNAISNTAVRLWKAMSAYADPRSGIRVLDVGSGGGDVLCRLSRLADRAGVRFSGVGCDISETACEYATSLAKKSISPSFMGSLEFRRIDCLQDDLPTEFDVAYSSLFLHHFSNDDAVCLLKRLRQASRRAVLIDDLLRSPTGYALAWIGTRLLSRSRIVHADGPLSVQAAFTMPELLELAASAGMKSATVTPHWPRRCLLQWTRS